jgi:hypothetical protein
MYIVYFNNKRLDLLRDKNLFTVTLSSIDLSDTINLNNKVKYKRIYNNKACIDDFTKRLERINLNIDRIRTGLSLMTWMFDSVMILPNTIDSEIINIGDNSSIKSLRELINSEVIVKECRDYLIKKHNL